MRQPQRKGVLLDTSIWVRYLRRGGDREIKAEVKRILSAERVFTCWVVKAELLVRARDDEAFERLSADLEALEEVPITPEVWLEAARLGYTLRRGGLNVPLPDLLIAQAAIAGELQLWHADEHFEYIKQLVPLETKAFIKSK